MVVKPRRHTRYCGDEKRALVCGGIETASMHDAGKEAAHRPAKGRRQNAKMQDLTPKLLRKGTTCEL